MFLSALSVPLLFSSTSTLLSSVIGQSKFCGHARRRQKIERTLKGRGWGEGRRRGGRDGEGEEEKDGERNGPKQTDPSNTEQEKQLKRLEVPGNSQE